MSIITMEDNRFFKFVWRVNGLLILIGAVLLLAVTVFGFLSSLIYSNSYTQPEVVESIAPDPDGVEKWVMGNPISVLGHDYSLFPLVSESREAQERGIAIADFASVSKFSSGYYHNPAKNVLFLKKSDNSSYWLYEDTARLILDISVFPGGYREKEPAEAIFYQVVSNDTNEDGVLTEDDASSLYMSQPDGSNYVVVLEAFDRLISDEASSKNQVILVYQYEGTVYSKLVQIKPYKVISSVRLPKISNS